MLRIGMLTPSSNTVLEPATSRMIDAIDNASVHYSRFAVTQIALDKEALGQFDSGPMLEAATLLSHAKVDVISWNGTSASWLGLDSDVDLIRQITERTGIAASTCVLSMMEAFAALGVKRYGLVSPYTDDVQQKIVDNLSIHGLQCGAEVHFGIRDNFSFGTVPAAQVESAMREVAKHNVDAIIILCTNLRGAELAASVEHDTGTPVLDSVTLTVWGAVKAAGISTNALSPWGPKLSQI